MEKTSKSRWQVRIAAILIFVLHHENVGAGGGLGCGAHWQNTMHEHLPMVAKGTGRETCNVCLSSAMGIVRRIMLAAEIGPRIRSCAVF